MERALLLANVPDKVYNSGVCERVSFIPGRLRPPGAPLARYRPVQPTGAAEAYVKHITHPGDLIVDLFCQGPTLVREAVGLERRVLGFSVNPLLLVAARLGLGEPQRDVLNAAFTHLADTPKGDVPLSHYLSDLYRSYCPACGVEGIAEWLAWDRDGHYPFQKAVRCPHCESIQQGPPDDDDLAQAQQTTPRGLAYYYALDRAAPPDHPARTRAAELVELYTPRNLSALMDILRRLEGLDADKATKLVLIAALIDCFDLCSSLDTADQERSRPRMLRIPARYLERNVWFCFEDRFNDLLAEQSQPTVPRAESASALLEDAASGYALVSYAASDVRNIIQPGSASLILVDPPRPDGVFWALSALWANWLWDTPSTRRLRPLLSRRRFDWEWHWRVLRAALRAAGPLLAPDARMVTLFSHPDETLLESLCLAASSGGYTLEEWGYSPEVGHRGVWRWREIPPAEAPEDIERLADRFTTTAAQEITDILDQRKEPTTRSLLHAGVYADLAQKGLLARAAAIPKGEPRTLPLVADGVGQAFASTAIAAIGDPEGERPQKEEAQYWLVDPRYPAETLADRVETYIWECLIQHHAWRVEDLVIATYRRFCGRLTPALGLVLVCIDSYTTQTGDEPRLLHLRPEDDPLQRAAELDVVGKDLMALGERLGFQAEADSAWDVRWLEDSKAVYIFDTTATAILTHHLLESRATAKGARRCLVLPGGRSQLVTFKLNRDPRLRRAVETDEWQFIKFRLLRHLVAQQSLDRYAFKTVLGLDPIAEQEAAQIPLF